MKESAEIKPKAKELFWLDARDHCKTNISWPMFEDAWARAKGVVPEAAAIWDKPGRPRKSSQK
jgi:hypothetical protein